MFFQRSLINNNRLSSCCATLGSIGTGHWCGEPGNLRACTNDALASRVIDIGHVLVLKLGALPDLDFTATAEDTDSHGGEKVVGGVGVVINTAIEDGGGILANGRRDQRLATRMVLDEVGNIVNDTGNGNKTLAVLGICNKVVPVHNGELFQRSTPVESGALLIKLLLHLLNTALFNFVGTELLEVIGETHHLPQADRPLGGIILIPRNSVTVVRGELVMEVVVTLAESDKSGNDVITGGVAIIEGLVTEPMGERVDTEGSLLNEADAKDAAIDEAAHIIAPQKSTEDGGEDQSHDDDTLEIVAVLPDDNGVLIEIGNVGTARALGVLLENHPAKMRVEKTLANGVGILLGVGIAMVGTMLPGPPADRTFDGASTDSSEIDFQGESSLV